MSKSLQKILPNIISGVLLGLSYPSFPEIPTGILAWFAFSYVIGFISLSDSAVRFEESVTLYITANNKKELQLSS